MVPWLESQFQGLESWTQGRSRNSKGQGRISKGKKCQANHPSAPRRIPP